MSLSTAIAIGIGTTPCSQVVAGGGGGGGSANEWSFADAPTGQAPPDSTTLVSFGGTATATVEDSGGSVDGKALQVARSAGNCQVSVTFDGAFADSQEGEVAGILQVDGTFAACGIGFANRDGANPPNGLLLYVYNGTVGLGAFQDSAATLATYPANTQFAIGVADYTTKRLAFRLNLTHNSGNGNRGYKAKVWDYEGAEPGSWMKELDPISNPGVAGPFDSLIFLAHLQGGAFGGVALLEWAGWSLDPDVSVELP